MKNFEEFQSSSSIAALRSESFNNPDKDEVTLLESSDVYIVKDQLTSSDKHVRISTPLDARLRRLRANDRERRRIQSINGAMEALRRVVPDTQNNRKVTKLQLLKLAQDYIRYLSDVLQTNANNSMHASAYRISTSTEMSIDPYVCYQHSTCGEHFMADCFSS